MKKLLQGLMILAGLVTLILSGCASGPAAAQGEHKAPDWVMNPPESDQQYAYFTGSGRSEGGDMAEAEEFARGAVLDEIMRYLGVRITSETTATARASLDSFKTDLVQQLTSKAAGRVTGLEITEKWAAEKDSTITLYLLARYNKTDLIKEKNRLEAVFQEKIEAVSGPEREARQFEVRGMPYQAALKYMEAAAAAFKSDIENAAIKFERNINQAKAVVRQIGLIKMNDNLEFSLGQKPAEAFKLKVVKGAEAGAAGLAEIAIQAVYRETKASGRRAVRSRLLKTDTQGFVDFLHPVTQFVGSEKVTMSLFLGEALESLREAPDSLIEQVESLEELILRKKVDFNFKSISLAAQVATGIAIFNLDASGNPISSTDTATGVLESMTRAGFRVQSLPVVVEGIAGKSDSQVVSFLRRNFADQITRAIFGTARIMDHNQDGRFVIIQVSGSIKVADLETGQILLSLDKSKRAQGTNASAALSAAFKKLGEDLGTTIIGNLR